MHEIIIAIIGSCTTLLGIWYNHSLTLKREALKQRKPNSLATQEDVSSQPTQKIAEVSTTKSSEQKTASTTENIYKSSSKVEQNSTDIDHDEYITFRIPRWWWRPDTRATMYSVTIGILLFSGISFIGSMPVPRSVPIIFWVFFITLGFFIISPTISLARKHLKDYKKFTLSIFIIASPIVYWIAMSMRLERFYVFSSESINMLLITLFTGAVIGGAYIHFSINNKAN